MAGVSVLSHSPLNHELVLIIKGLEASRLTSYSLNFDLAPWADIAERTCQMAMHGRSWHFSTKTLVYARDALGGALCYGERVGVVRTKVVLIAGDWLCPKDTSRFP